MCPIFQSDLPSVVASVKRLAKESGLIPTHHWVSKVEQLLTLACLKHGKHGSTYEFGHSNKGFGSDVSLSKEYFLQCRVTLGSRA